MASNESCVGNDVLLGQTGESRRHQSLAIRRHISEQELTASEIDSCNKRMKMHKSIDDNNAKSLIAHGNRSFEEEIQSFDNISVPKRRRMDSNFKQSEFANDSDKKSGNSCTASLDSSKAGDLIGKSLQSKVPSVQLDVKIVNKCDRDLMFIGGGDGSGLIKNEPDDSAAIHEVNKTIQNKHDGHVNKIQNSERKCISSNLCKEEKNHKKHETSSDCKKPEHCKNDRKIRDEPSSHSANHHGVHHKTIDRNVVGNIQKKEVCNKDKAVLHAFNHCGKEGHIELKNCNESVGECELKTKSSHKKYQGNNTESSRHSSVKHGDKTKSHDDYKSSKDVKDTPHTKHKKSETAPNTAPCKKSDQLVDSQSEVHAKRRKLSFSEHDVHGKPVKNARDYSTALEHKSDVTDNHNVKHVLKNSTKQENKTAKLKLLSNPSIQTELDYRLRLKSQPLDGLKFGHLIFIEKSATGGATVVHSYQDDLNLLSKEELEEFVDEYFKVVFKEEPFGVSQHVMGIIHGAADYIPDLIEHFADNYPEMIVKRTLLGKSDIDTLNMASFRDLVRASYCAGTYRCGPLLQLSLVGTKSEECGGYFPEFLDIIESNPFLNAVMPWGSLSRIHGFERNLSNDGPILWSRPGEQVVPTADLAKSPAMKKRGINELRNLMYLPRSGECRETFVEDRTKAHADHVGEGPDRMTTAAVGLLKAVHCGEKYTENRVVKEAICFHAENFRQVAEKLRLDLHEPPMTQCIAWVDDAKLNQLHREGIKYAIIQLRDDDIYFIPRNIVHQFKTRTAVTSVAWHVRLKSYYADKEELKSTDEIMKEEPQTSSMTTEKEFPRKDLSKSFGKRKKPIDDLKKVNKKIKGSSNKQFAQEIGSVDEKVHKNNDGIIESACENKSKTMASVEIESKVEEPQSVDNETIPMKLKEEKQASVAQVTDSNINKMWEAKPAESRKIQNHGNELKDVGAAGKDLQFSSTKSHSKKLKKQLFVSIEELKEDTKKDHKKDSERLSKDENEKIIETNTCRQKASVSEMDCIQKVECAETVHSGSFTLPLDCPEKS